MKRLAGLRARIDTWRPLEARVRELLDLADLAEAEDDPSSVVADIDRDAAEIERRLDAL